MMLVKKATPDAFWPLRCQCWAFVYAYLLSQAAVAAGDPRISWGLIPHKGWQSNYGWAESFMSSPWLGFCYSSWWPMTQSISCICKRDACSMRCIPLANASGRLMAFCTQTQTNHGSVCRQLCRGLSQWAWTICMACWAWAIPVTCSHMACHYKSAWAFTLVLGIGSGGSHTLS